MKFTVIQSTIIHSLVDGDCERESMCGFFSTKKEAIEKIASLKAHDELVKNEFTWDHYTVVRHGDVYEQNYSIVEE